MLATVTARAYTLSEEVIHRILPDIRSIIVINVSVNASVISSLIVINACMILYVIIYISERVYV